MGIVRVLHASLSRVPACAYVTSFVIGSLSCRRDECARTRRPSSSRSSPVVLFSQPLAEQLEDISPVSGEPGAVTGGRALPSSQQLGYLVC